MAAPEAGAETLEFTEIITHVNRTCCIAGGDIHIPKNLVRQFELYHEARKTKSHSSHFVRSEDTVAAMLDDLLHLQQATCDGNRPRNYSAGLMRTADL